jgi:Ni,Fe-hydrogenase III small subunit
MYYWHWLRHIVRRPFTTGFPTEPDPTVARMADSDAVHIVTVPEGPFYRRSVALRHVDSGSCNGCESELGLLTSPDYDFSRYGFSFTPSPKHADILVVTGVVTEAMIPVIVATYEQMTAPKRVVALGACAIDGWVFRDAPGVRGRLDSVIPVQVNIAGCPPTPADILRGLWAAIEGEPPPLPHRDGASRAEKQYELVKGESR